MCWEQVKASYIPWGERPRLISNALCERKLSTPVRSPFSLHRTPSSLYSTCSFLSHLLHSLLLTPLVFHLTLCLFLRILQGFTLNEIFHSLGPCWGHSWWNWNSCLTSAWLHFALLICSAFTLKNHSMLPWIWLQFKRKSKFISWISKLWAFHNFWNQHFLPFS